MIIGPDFVYLAIPRTASHSISYHWAPHYGGEWWPRPADWAPGENAEDWFHLNLVPADHAHKFCWATVRNPYDRVSSLWRYIAGWEGVERFPWYGIGHDDFPAWLLTRPVINPRTPDLFRSQAEFLSKARVDAVVHYEELEAGLRRLPFVRGREWHPVIHSVPAILPPQSYTAKFVDGVNEYERDSFRLYGYPGLFPIPNPDKEVVEA